ncbi:B-box type zinc finger protein with CCT domain-containing protein [Actinidia rufa]|uniref:B-box type zinc finger protein with CCT domain-containing protein n=1 Tax=Actinidia rufa TaxID=165716 RepID=A0A7J0FMH9_9ERIC|nr:B-box type zinc finger protein with CCT domain-containing protein [Actinidia rufa]
MDVPGGGDFGGRGTAGEGIHGAAAVGSGDGRGCMGVGVAAGAEDEVVGGATDGSGGQGAVVADLGAAVLEREGVGSVDVVVAEQAELGRVRLAGEHRSLVVAVVARHSLFSSRFAAHHLSLSLWKP